MYLIYLIKYVMMNYVFPIISSIKKYYNYDYKCSLFVKRDELVFRLVFSGPIKIQLEFLEIHNIVIKLG